MNLSRKILSDLLLSIFFTCSLFFTTSPISAETIDMQYTDPDHLHAPKEVTIDGVETDYQYDANGNLVNDGERVISWNQDNMPTKIVKGDQTVEFFYDADGNRIIKKIGEDKIVYVSNSYQKSTINGQETTTKYYFANGRIAQLKEDNLSYLYQDHLGSNVLVTDSNSEPLGKALSYFPYGSFVAIQPFSHSSYLFTGQEQDPEIDLYNYNARLYNPRIGSFISADILDRGAGNSQGLNRYSYVVNNPLRYTDPSGLHIPGEDPDPEDMLMWIKEFSRSREREEEKFPLDRLLMAVSEIPEDIRVNGINSSNWDKVRPIFEKWLSSGSVGWLRASVGMNDFLQCLALFGSYAEEAGAEVPGLGEGPHRPGLPLRDLDWYSSEQIQKGLFQVEQGDILFYQRSTGPDSFSSHWAIVTEMTAGGAKLLEAMGGEFKWGMGTEQEIYVGAGGILVNERTFNFESGTVIGADVVEWGVYRVNPKK